MTALPRVDPIELARSNQLASLPLPSLLSRSIANVTNYSTASQYLALNAVPNPKARLAAMLRDEFRGGVDVGFVSGADNYGIIVLRFASASQALDYFAAHLRDICSIAVSVQPLPQLVGVSYLRSDDLAKATFVVGDTEVQLDVCTCVETKDRVALASRWATSVAQQLKGH